jgi:hypothetical protein
MLNPGAEAGEIEAGGGQATFARAMLASVHCLSVLPAPKSQRGLGRSTP